MTLSSRWQQSFRGQVRSRAALVLALGYVLLLVPLLLHSHAGQVDVVGSVAPTAAAQMVAAGAESFAAPVSDDCLLCDLIAFGLLAASPALLLLPFRRWRIAFFARLPRLCPQLRGRSRSPRAPPVFS